MPATRIPNIRVRKPEPKIDRSTQENLSRGDVFLLAVAERLAELGSLTPRMSEALALHIRGWPRTAAAAEMGCSENTYRNHLASALRRIGADAPSELFRVLAQDLDANESETLARAVGADEQPRAAEPS